MSPNPLEYTIPFQLTKTIRRDPYDALAPTRPENSAKGKIILITGGGTGIGAAAAVVWAKAGADGVVLAGRRVEKLEAAAAEVRANGKARVLTVRADLVQDSDVENLFAQSLKFFGRSPDVVLANAGVVENVPIGEHDTESWWNIMSINLKGLYATAHHFIKSQPDPKNPTGTFITTNSGLGGIIAPGLSSYSISKLAGQRFIEYLSAEYPSLHSFTLFPGIVLTDIVVDPWFTYALDHADLSGMLALYLASSRGEWLKGCLTSVNWDIEEMEANKEKILKEDLLKIKWIPVLPASGGEGL